MEGNDPHGSHGHVCEGDRACVLPLFKHALTSTYFCFDGQFCEQMDGVAMGSPLYPVNTNFFIEDFEKKATEQATHKPSMLVQICR